MSQPANYQVQQLLIDNVAVVQLRDSAHAAQVSIATALGNMAYQFRTAGEELLWFPFDSPAGLQAKPTFCAIPFLAPWANRLDGDAYYANGRRYQLNPDLGNLRRDAHQKPIHGLLNFSPYWESIDQDADESSAWTTARLEFSRHPELMAQFPFAHTILMTHRLIAGQLEVETVIANQGAEPLPIAIGHHPYFRLPGVPRDQWQVHIAARDHLQLNEMLIPTGESTPVEPPQNGAILDDVFANLIRHPDGRARFHVQGAGRRITVTYGPKYTIAIVYAPAGKDFICFEPMSAITNAFNLAHTGVYKDLQTIPPAGTWKETFSIAYAPVP